jgi:hypothetical protein
MRKHAERNRISQVLLRMANASKGVLSLSQTPDRSILTESQARVNGISKSCGIFGLFRGLQSVQIPKYQLALTLWEVKRYLKVGAAIRVGLARSR